MGNTYAYIFLLQKNKAAFISLFGFRAHFFMSCMHVYTAIIYVNVSPYYFNLQLNSTNMDTTFESPPSISKGIESPAYVGKSFLENT